MAVILFDLQEGFASETEANLRAPGRGNFVHLARGCSGFSLEMTPFSLGILVIIEVICIGEKRLPLVYNFLLLISVFFL